VIILDLRDRKGELSLQEKEKGKKLGGTSGIQIGGERISCYDIRRGRKVLDIKGRGREKSLEVHIDIKSPILHF